MQKIFLIFLGPPASGKGTQADKVGALFKLPIISPGELLRHERETGTAIGAAVKEKMDRGELVGNEIIEKLIDQALAHDKAKEGAIFDGYPRNQGQLKQIMSRLQKITSNDDSMYGIFIDVSDRIVKERISGRRACDCGTIYHLKYNPPKQKGVCDLCGKKLYTRSDDKPVVVKERLEEYHRDNKPLVDYFREHGKLITINGEKGIDEVNGDILKELNYKGISAN